MLVKLAVISVSDTNFGSDGTGLAVNTEEAMTAQPCAVT